MKTIVLFAVLCPIDVSPADEGSSNDLFARQLPRSRISYHFAPNDVILIRLARVVGHENSRKKLKIIFVSLSSTIVRFLLWLTCSAGALIDLIAHLTAEIALSNFFFD